VREWLLLMTFDVEIVLKGRDFAVTRAASVEHGEPASWDQAAVRDVLVEILRAIALAENPDAAPDRIVVLQGFSWIVEPSNAQVVIAIEIPMGAAVAGPFTIGQAELDALISQVLRAERQLVAPRTVH
jgi:hypothetical protein